MGSKLAYLINTLSAGGAELQLLTLCRELKKRGVEVTVACLREKVKDSRLLRADFEKEGIRVVNLAADSRYDVAFPFRVNRLLGEEKPDLLHTHLPRADLAGAFAHWRTPAVPWIASVHGIYETHWSGSSTMPLVRRAWRRADRVVAISNAVREWLVHRQHVPPAKVAVVHYGIDLAPFLNGRDDFRKEWSLGEDPVIGTIGRLEPLKGHQTLIRAMADVIKPFPNAKLLIAGHDPWNFGKHLKSIIASLGLENNVRLLGFQSDIPKLIRTFDLFAFGSESEGFGQVVVEAMAAGKPVVACRIAPLTEIVKDGETGHLVGKGDSEAFSEAIIERLKYRERSAVMGAKGLGRAKAQFRSSIMAERMSGLYRGVIGN
jgi:glycosyltransferase involved in cell wall biosynthesis